MKCMYTSMNRLENKIWKKNDLILNFEFNLI